MTNIQRPNREALIQATDIYRDCGRRFIVRHLRKVPGKGVENAIRTSLNRYQQDQFDANIASNRSVEESIDIGLFPVLVSRNWEGIFAEQFSHDRDVQDKMNIIKSARDTIVAHPRSQDVGPEEAKAYLFFISETLRRINEPGAADEVSNLCADIPDANMSSLATEMGQMAMEITSIRSDNERADSEIDRLAGGFAEYKQKIEDEIEVLKSSLGLMQNLKQNLANELAEVNQIPERIREALAEFFTSQNGSEETSFSEEESFDDDFELDDLQLLEVEPLEISDVSRRHSVRPKGLFAGALYYCVEPDCRFSDGSPSVLYPKYVGKSGQRWPVFGWRSGSRQKVGDLRW